MRDLPQNATRRLVSRQLPARLQADLLGRLAITLRAGIDLRKAWASEVQANACSLATAAISWNTHD